MVRGEATRVVFLCTGNAARSVMAAVMWRDRVPTVPVIGAGTHVIEGLPMSSRVRGALADLGLADPRHRSHQLTQADVDQATVVVGFAPEHAAYVRRMHPDAAVRTGTIKRLVRDLRTDGRPLAHRLGRLGLDRIELDDWEEVDDPAGGDEVDFKACAAEVDALIDQLIPLVVDG